MDATKCDGRHRARRHCPDPECYLKDVHPPTLGESADAEALEEHEAKQQKLYDDADNLVATDDGGAERPKPDEQTQEEEQRWLDEARSTLDRLASEPIEFGPGIFRWHCVREGGYQRTEYAHELPPCPAGWRWSSAQVTAVGGRGKLHVSAAVVAGSEGANAPTGPQSLVLEITGRGGYCTGLDVVLFARPAEVRR